MQYRSLNLEAFDYKKEGEVESFNVLISNSPAGGMTKSEATPVTLPPDLRPRLRRLDKRFLTLPEMIKVGEDLGAVLFPPRLRPLLERSRAALAENVGLRIRLMLDAYALADIPWEYIYLADPDTPPEQKDISGFLALDRSISILRDLVLEQRRGELTPVANQALRMVVLLSNPNGTEELDLETEKGNIDKAVREIRDITVQYYPNATIDLLEEATINEAHIFHYSGHGNFELAPGGKEGKGFLALTGVNGGEELFPASRLAGNLRSCGVRLAMLGACESSRVDQVNAWTGVAPTLMRAGIPAVVGMQFSVYDENAVLFSKAFYRVLAAGKSIDEGVTAGRRAISNRADDAERDWGAPALYLRAEGDGILFPRAADAASIALKGAEDKLKGDLAESFQASLQQIDVVKDYKDLHDNLHDLQFWFALVRPQVSSLPDAKGAIQALRSQEGFLSNVNTKLRDTVENGKVAAEEAKWVGILEKAGTDLELALETPEPAMDLLSAAIANIGGVLQTRPTYINGNLMRAVGALRINHLIEIVQRVFDESIVKSSSPKTVEGFQQGIEALKKINVDLTSLINEHDTWQRNEGKISIIRMVRNLADFEIAWEQVKADTSFLYSNSGEEWAKKMKLAETSLDLACKEKNELAATHWFNKFSEHATRRFWNVDKAIKHKCEELVEIRTKMESI